MAITNAKTRLANMYHGIRPKFLQEYPNEFCYKFNRCHFGDRLFDRLVIVSISSVSRFKHCVYNQKLSVGYGQSFIIIGLFTVPKQLLTL